MDLGQVSELEFVFSSVGGARNNTYLIGLLGGVNKYIKVFRMCLAQSQCSPFLLASFMGPPQKKRYCFMMIYSLINKH